MLKHSIHLELLRITAIEEAQHIVDSNTTVKDTTSNKEINSLSQLQLSLIVQHRLHLTRNLRVHHIDRIIIELKNMSNTSLNLIKRWESLVNHTTLTTQLIRQFQTLVCLKFQIQNTQIRILIADKRSLHVLNDTFNQIRLPLVILLVNLNMDKAASLVHLTISLLLLDSSDCS